MSPKKISITLIIPAKNEEQNLPWVFKRIKKISHHLGKYEIILIDGHSSDKTRQIAKAFGAHVFLDHQKGKGEALRVGAQKAKGNILVFLDADGSHHPKDILKLLNPIRKKNFDHVSGSRMIAGSDELHKELGQFIRLMGSAIISLGINYRFKTRLTDCQNGFRAIKKSVFHSLNLCENRTTIEQEMIIKTLKKGYSIIEVPTHEYERRSGKSHISIWKHGFRYLYSWFKYMYFG